jgi:ABC-type branched-subunit amino acid transport system ATPase component
MRRTAAMLDSLRITGFRAFSELSVERLGRVTLVVGKNNVGKTTLLEAVHLHASGTYALSAARRILERRDEYLADEPDAVDLERLFHRTNGTRSDIARISNAAGGHALELSTNWAWWEGDDEHRDRRQGTTPPDDVDAQRQMVARLHNLSGRGWRDVWVALAHPDTAIYRPKLRDSPSVLLPSAGFRAEAIDIADLWDDVVLTDREQKIVDVLQVVEPDLERIVMVKAGRSRRTAVAKVKDRSPLPLRSLGDGMNRLLEVALGLVTVGEGGSFLVDEIDSGLHFTTLVDVWRLVFESAARFDVQVLATTHSWDCIEAFQQAAVAHPAEGVLVRLQRTGDVITSEAFTEDELTVITRESIEVR